MALIYYLIPQKFRWLVIVLFNIYFYIMAMGDKFIILLITSFLVYIAGIILDRSNSKSNKTYLLFSFISALILSLLYYKYYNFIRLNIKSILVIPERSIIAPIGVSFYTLQAISYLVDIYKGKILSEKHLGHFFAYLGFFATILSGPIERAEKFLPQMKKEKVFNLDTTFLALEIIALGVFKKVVIADRVGLYVDKIFNNPYGYSSTPVLLAFILYSIQLYADFSGYSLLALGFSKLLGFEITDNFKYPYFSASVREFWGRWHISLSSFLQTYVYFPLGGSRVSPWRKPLNTLTVFLVSGLWHGANWTFIIWGGLHGLYVVFDNLIKSFRTKTVLRIPNTIFTFIQLTFAWIFFRAANVKNALHLIKASAIKEVNTMSSILNLMNIPQLVALLILIIFLFSYEFLLYKDKKINPKLRFAVNAFIIISIILLGGATQSQFIYFKF
jgi:D-alanyl-lipoteichoic acid acyltransferase DltB (MBOAT superfamily)